MKVWIDQDLCTGDGLCEEIAPDVFVGLDDGLFYVKEGDKVYAALRFGDWTKIEGVCFPELDERKHLIPTYRPQPNDVIIRGFDYGFSAPFATVWIAFTGEKKMIVFAEYVGTKDGTNKGLQLPANEVARNIKDIEKANNFITAVKLAGAVYIAVAPVLPRGTTAFLNLTVSNLGISYYFFFS